MIAAPVPTLANGPPPDAPAAVAGRATVIIPAYDPDPATLLEVVRGLGERGFDRFLVVDDGSAPAPARVFGELAAMPGVTVLRHAANQGKGAALKTAFNEFLKHDDKRVAVTVDADGQHHPDDVARVALAGCHSPDALILGVRTDGQRPPLRSRLGNWLTRGIFRIVTGVWLTDTQTGLRVWPRKLMRICLASDKRGFDFETEALLVAFRNGIPWKEVGIRKLYFEGNRSSNFNPVRDSLLIYWVILRFCMGSAVVASVDYLFFIIVYARTRDIPMSFVAARAVAICIAFLVSRSFVFRHRGREVLAQAVKFVLLVAALGAVSIFLTSAMVVHWGIPAVLAKAIAEGSLLIVSFTVQSRVVFVHRFRDDAPGPAAPSP